MMTVITHVKLRPGAEPEWDEAIRERLQAARNERGWIGAELLMPLDALDARVIVGTWQTRADWERWHESDAFATTRERLGELEVAAQETRWYETVSYACREDDHLDR